MTHLGYILAAYLVTAAVLVGMVAFVALDLRRVKRKLAGLEDADGRRHGAVR